MKALSNGVLPKSASEEERKNINSELWHACAGPLVNLPPVGSLVVYFPQGHSEQVSASMQKEADFEPSYPNLPSKLICKLHNVTLHADLETDEVYAQMTLQPVNQYDREALIASEMALKHNKQPAEFFCKTLTASDTSTHGGFSVPRRAAEKIFPPLDFSMQPPCQELGARDLHDNAWTFRHIYRGQPKRHLLTTGWSAFVSNKRLFADDSVLFIRDEKQQLLLGIRHANRQQSALASSVISSDSMHIGILAAAAHAAANNSPFTIFYNPRASPSEFVVPLAKYNKAMYTQVSLGMRFRMMFEIEESGVRRYMGTITSISDFDPVRWKNSQWRNLQVGWDESTAGDRPSRVSIWEIEPVVTPFYICPLPFFRPKFPRQPGMPDDESDIENSFKRAMPWLGDEFGMMKDAPNSIFPGLSLVQWMSMQQNNQAAQSGFFPSMVSPHNSNVGSTDDPSKLLNFQSPATLPQASMQFNKVNPQNQVGQLPQPPIGWPQQQQLQQLLRNSANQQPQQQQQQLHQTMSQPQTLPQQQSPHQQQQQQQQLFQSATVSNSFVSQNQTPNLPLMQQNVYSQLQQQTLSSNSPPAQSLPLANKNLYPPTSAPHDTQFQQQIEQQQQHSSLLHRQPHQAQLQQSPLQHSSLSQRTQQQQPQLSQQNVSDQLQLLQKLQQQQLISSGNSLLRPQQQQSQAVQQQWSQNQQPFTSNSFSSSVHVQSSQPYPGNQHQIVQKTPTIMKAQSGVTDGDAPSCSTSPSTNNCQIPPSDFLSRNKQGPSLLIGDSPNFIQDKNEIQIKQESLPISRGPDQLIFKSSIISTNQLEASTSGTSYCLEAGGNMQQNFSLPPFCVDGDIQSHSRGSIPFTANIDGLDQIVQKTPTIMTAQSGVTNGDAPSCSTSPSTNNCQIPPSDFLSRNKQGPSLLIEDSPNFIQDKNKIQIKQESLPISRRPDQLVFKSSIISTDQLEASTSGTSYCLEASGNMQPNFSPPPFCVDGDIQSHSRGSIPFTVNIDGLGPNTLLSRGYESRGYDSQKDLQNLLANYSGTNPRDIETKLSTAGISSQSFGVPNISFKPGCSTDIGFDNTGVLNNELWAKQTQPRLRMYTKVQKRGSVGRSIDVTRYNNYDELRRDLARMFGIEGQLEDPQSSDWKLVFMDPENDMLLVGDDPWEDFLICVQSIKILSAVEVQNMSLAGDLGNVPVPNQSCSGTDSGNVWRGHYDDISAASFDR